MRKLVNPKYKNVSVFVYCGGKCGSTTLTETLNKYYKTLHVHNSEYFQTILPINEKNKYSIFDVIEYNRVRHKDIYIIDSYRTPIERKISSFFQNIHTHLPQYKSLKLRDIIHYFNKNLLNVLEEYHSIDEIMQYYEVEPFNSFDFDKKYKIVSKLNIHFIKIRFNEINSWDNILSEIFQKEIKIYPDNLSENKDYKYLYNQFKKYYYVPSNYFNNILPNDKQFKIYNTEEEQQKYYDKWSQRLLKEK